MRSTRLETSTPQLDAAETEWWDRFSATCERLWTFGEHTARAARGAYLETGVAYLGGASGGESVILDLGCGSGFTSRFFAERGLKVVGVDTSSEQIRLARMAAAAAPAAAAERMEFRVASSSSLQDSDQRFDGVIAHAFLHHLAKDELRGLLDDIAGLLRPGGRAWFLEPVFYPPGRPLLAARVTQAGALASAVAQRAMRTAGQIERAPLDAAERFFAEAEREGWFLSPKEVPFAPTELASMFGGRLTLDHFAWVSTASYATAQWVSLIRRPRLRRALATGLVRPHARADLAIGRTGGMQRLRGLEGYGFAALACRVAD